MHRRWIILAVVGCAVLGVILARHWLNPLPRYDGRDVETWFRQYYESGINSPAQDPEANRAAVDAFHAIGTNAVPFLLAECFSTYQDTAFASNAMRVFHELPEPLRSPPFVPADAVRESAAELVGQIRPPASMLIPHLTNALAGTNFARYTATMLLGCVGSESDLAVPHLRPILVGSDFQQRAIAINAISQLGEGARDLLPDLIPLLTNSTALPGLGRWQRWTMTRAVGGMGPAAAPAVPILKQQFEAETNQEFRLQLAIALCRIRSDESAPLLSLIQKYSGERAAASTNSDRKAASAQSGMVQRMAWALGDLGTNGQPVVPFLLELLDDDQNNVWSLAAGSLGKIRPAKELVVPHLEKRLTGTEPNARYDAAMAILGFDHHNQPAIAALVDLAAGGSGRKSLALTALGKLGADARSAIPVLREVASNPGPYRQIAAKSLRQIEGK